MARHKKHFEEQDPPLEELPAEMPAVPMVEEKEPIALGDSLADFHAQGVMLGKLELGVIEAKAKPVDALSVVAPAGRFSRCGKHFSKAPTVIPLDELAPDEIKRLTEEPNLVTEFVNL